MNKLINILLEINRTAENSNPVIYDLSIDALSRAQKIMKTIQPNYEKVKYVNRCACEYDDTCPTDR